MAQVTKNLMPAEVQQHAIDSSPWMMLSEAILAPRDDFATLPAMARETVADLENSYREHMATKVSQAAASKAAKESKSEKVSRDDLNNFATTECIIPGVPLYFGLTAQSITQEQAGLLLQGLHRWANQNALGGGSARGRGAFIPSLSLTIDGERITDSLINGDAPRMTLAESPRIQALIDASNARLEKDATPESLEVVYPIEVGKDKEKKSKKAAVAA